MQKIIVEKTNHYGLERIYVVDEKLREAISSLTGRKSLFKRDIEALKVLGFTFQTKAEESVDL